MDTSQPAVVQLTGDRICTETDKAEVRELKRAEGDQPAMKQKASSVASFSSKGNLSNEHCDLTVIQGLNSIPKNECSNMTLLNCHQALSSASHNS